ncbi:MAG: DUF1573 domain-containing protein [Verrucomicrobiota bacterium]
MNLFIRTCLAVLSIPLICKGSLTWETREVSQTVDISAKEAIASFPFTNSGDQTITITEVKTSCGCTATSLDKKTYAPGESGEIEAVLNIGDRLGLQRKTVRVYTDNGADPALLTMTTTIPKVLEISPRFLFWKQGEAFAPKSIDLSVGVDAPVNITSIQSSAGQFKTMLSVVEEGKQYNLRVSAVGTGKQRAVITIVTDYPAEDPKTYRIHAHVR